VVRDAGRPACTSHLRRVSPGRLVGLWIETGHRGRKPAVEATLCVDVYGDGTHARHRTPLTATFGGVREVVTTINCAELVDMGECHIVFARLNETSDTLDLSIHLAGGHVRIVAERFAVATSLRGVCGRAGAE
jgi:hypothetical protein